MRILFIAFILFNASIVFAKELPLNLLKLPPGFSISIYAFPIANARAMALGSKDIVFVGSITAGKVYAVVPDANTPYKTRVVTIASNLAMPNGVAFYKQALYVADLNRILRFDHIEQHLHDPPKPVVITEALPKAKHHGWRYIRFGPDGKLYVSVGAPCNVCLSTDERFATIMRMNPDGTDPEVYAHGVRNSVGFAFAPSTKELWFTDNGRDWLGNDEPADEVNVAPQKNLHFGFPYCHGKSISDPEFGKKFPCSTFVPPRLALPAHVAALGMTFYTGKMFPNQYKNNLFIAEHGSWNRDKKIGYQVISVKQENNTLLPEAFITGWLRPDETVWGRPVDVLEMRDGSLLVSDDYANVIYRITYRNSVIS